MKLSSLKNILVACVDGLEGRITLWMGLMMGFALSYGIGNPDAAVVYFNNKLLPLIFETIWDAVNTTLSSLMMSSWIVYLFLLYLLFPVFLGWCLRMIVYVGFGHVLGAVIYPYNNVLITSPLMVYVFVAGLVVAFLMPFIFWGYHLLKFLVRRSFEFVIVSGCRFLR